MKKKISLLICMLVMVMSFAGCSAKSTMEYDEASLTQVAEFLISYCNSADDTVIAQWKGMSEFSVEQQIYDASLPLTRESFIAAMESWQAGLDECGAYIEHGDFTYEAGKDEVIVTTPAVFENREATLKFVFDENQRLDTLTVSGSYSMGEILEKAGLNTVLGMGTVFVVLIFIAFIISLFKYIPVIQEKFSKKSAGTTVASVEAKAGTTSAETEEVDDLELIAVIAAAIAAAEGTTTDGFVVRSIKRRPSNKWRA